MTPEEAAELIEALQTGGPDRELDPAEVDGLEEFVEAAADPAFLSDFRRAVRARSSLRFRRTMTAEDLSGLLGGPPAFVELLAEAGLLSGTRTPDGQWLFGIDDVDHSRAIEQGQQPGPATQGDPE